MLDSFDKGWFVLQTYSGYENKVKETLLQRAQTYNMLDNILRVEIPTQTVNVEKNGKVKEVEENLFYQIPFYFPCDDRPYCHFIFSIILE